METNEDGTHGPQHITDEGRELVSTQVEERVDHKKAEFHALIYAKFAPDTKVGNVSRAYLDLLTERSASEELWQAVADADREWAEATLADDHGTPAKHDRKVAACANFAHAARAYLEARLSATEPAQPEEER